MNIAFVLQCVVFLATLTVVLIMQQQVKSFSIQSG